MLTNARATQRHSFIELQINNKNNEYKFSRELGFDINWGTKEEYNEWMKRENMDERNMFQEQNERYNIKL